MTSSTFHSSPGFFLVYRLCVYGPICHLSQTKHPFPFSHAQTTLHPILQPLVHYTLGIVTLITNVLLLLYSAPVPAALPLLHCALTPIYHCCTMSNFHCCPSLLLCHCSIRHQFPCLLCCCVPATLTCSVFQHSHSMALQKGGDMQLSQQHPQVITLYPDQLTPCSSLGCQPYVSSKRLLSCVEQNVGRCI